MELLLGIGGQDGPSVLERLVGRVLGGGGREWVFEWGVTVLVFGLVGWVSVTPKSIKLWRRLPLTFISTRTQKRILAQIIFLSCRQTLFYTFEIRKLK